MYKIDSKFKFYNIYDLKLINVMYIRFIMIVCKNVKFNFD